MEKCRYHWPKISPVPQPGEVRRPAGCARSGWPANRPGDRVGRADVVEEVPLGVSNTHTRPGKGAGRDRLSHTAAPWQPQLTPALKELPAMSRFGPSWLGLPIPDSSAHWLEAAGPGRALDRGALQLSIPGEVDGCRLSRWPGQHTLPCREPPPPPPSPGAGQLHSHHTGRLVCLCLLSLTCFLVLLPKADCLSSDVSDSPALASMLSLPFTGLPEKDTCVKHAVRPVDITGRLEVQARGHPTEHRCLPPLGASSPPRLPSSLLSLSPMPPCSRKLLSLCGIFLHPKVYPGTSVLPSPASWRVKCTLL